MTAETRSPTSLCAPGRTYGTFVFLFRCLNQRKRVDIVIDGPGYNQMVTVNDRTLLGHNNPLPTQQTCFLEMEIMRVPKSSYTKLGKFARIRIDCDHTPWVQQRVIIPVDQWRVAKTCPGQPFRCHGLAIGSTQQSDPRAVAGH